MPNVPTDIECYFLITGFKCSFKISKRTLTIVAIENSIYYSNHPYQHMVTASNQSPFFVNYYYYYYYYYAFLNQKNKSIANCT